MKMNRKVIRQAQNGLIVDIVDIVDKRRRGEKKERSRSNFKKYAKRRSTWSPPRGL